VSNLTTPYSPIKRYPLPYGKPWFPPFFSCNCGCGRGPEIGALTKAQSGYLDEAEFYDTHILPVYEAACSDWPWLDSEPVQLDLFAGAK
jgi:hypothetical protein